MIQTLNIVDPRKDMYDKLINEEIITHEDIQSLEMFNDVWIDKLLNAGQDTVRAKMVEALTREGIEVYKC